MNTIETILLGLLEGAEQDAPLFVSSAKGTLLVNASENLLNNVVALLAAKAAAQATAQKPAPPAPPAPDAPVVTIAPAATTGIVTAPIVTA